MSMVAKIPVEPTSSSEIVLTDSARAAEIEEKQQLVAEFLEKHRYDGLLLEKPSNFAWFTAGGACCRYDTANASAALFITADARVLVTPNVDSGRLFDIEIPGAGFQLKQRPWHEPRHKLLEDLCRGRTVASDSGFGPTTDVSLHLSRMRLPLTDRECTEMRKLGRDIVHAVEATARQCKHGQTEAEIAGEVSHRLIKQHVVPEQIQVAADGRSRRYRHWGYGSKSVERYCVISAIGSRGGLCAGTSRTVSFGPPPEEIRDSHHRAMLVHATGLRFSQPDWELGQVWKRIVRIYEKFGHPEEWQQSPQAEIISYSINEVPLVPGSEFTLSPQMPVHWHPAIGPAIAGDTILVSEKGAELLTPMENWPKLAVEVKGTRVDCPEVLRRDLDGNGGRGTSSAPYDDSDDTVLELDLSPEEEDVFDVDES